MEASDALVHSSRPGFDDARIGQDFSQVAVDAANEAHVSTPPGPPGRILFTGVTEDRDMVTTDIPDPTVDGVPDNGQGG